jgi:UDP-N-acetylglucosamine acyltransferase
MTDTYGKIEFANNNTFHQFVDDLESWEWVGSNKIHKTALIDWEHVEIGENNTIGPYCVIGADAQSVKLKSKGIITIGDNNIFREAISVNRPTEWSELTAIEDNCYLMINAHIAHDNYIESNCVISNNTALGGHVYIMRNTQIGFNVSVHQYNVIGSYCMFGLGAVVTRAADLKCGTLWHGNPARFQKFNEVGLQRNNLAVEDMKTENERRQSIIEERSKY